MKTIKVLIIMLFLTSCIKRGPISVEGILMSSCDTPASNKKGYIYQGGEINGGLWAEFTTDEHGYFKVIENRTNDSDFTIRVQGSSDVLRGIKKSKSIDLGKVYINPPSTSYYLKLQVNNSTYNESDTLYYQNGNFPQNGGTPWGKISGPFINGVFDTVPIIFNMTAMPLVYGSSSVPKIRLLYHINDYDSWTVKEVYFETPHCVDEYQTVTLVID